MVSIYGIARVLQSPSRVVSIAIVDFRIQKAFDQTGNSLPFHPDWTRELESRPDSKRSVYFTIARPLLGDRGYRIRFGGSQSHSTGANPGRVAEVSSSFPITDNSDSVRVDVEEVGGSWETIYEGRAGDSTENALWNLKQANGPLLTLREACPQDRQHDYAFRLTLDPPLREYENRSPEANSSGRIHLFGQTDAPKLRKVKIERSRFQSVFSDWLAFGAKGSAQTARRVGSVPTFAAAFTGRLDRSEGSRKYFRRDKIGWSASGQPVEISREKYDQITHSFDGKLPGWVAFRVPNYPDGANFRLFDDNGNCLDAETEIFDSSTGQGKVVLKSIHSSLLRPRMNFVLKVGSGDFKEERKAEHLVVGDPATLLKEGEFLVLDNYWGKSNAPMQVSVMAGFTLTESKDYRIAPFDSKGTRLGAGGEIRGDKTIGTHLDPNEREIPVSKVVLESRPFATFVFKDIPMIKPAGLSQNRQ